MPGTCLLDLKPLLCVYLSDVDPFAKNWSQVLVLDFFCPSCASHLARIESHVIHLFTNDRISSLDIFVFAYFFNRASHFRVETRHEGPRF